MLAMKSIAAQVTVKQLYCALDAIAIIAQNERVSLHDSTNAFLNVGM